MNCDKKLLLYRRTLRQFAASSQRNKEMSELEFKEVQELLIGTWIGIALLADTLIEHGVLPRKELLLALSQTEEAASDKRRTALAGLRLLIRCSFRCTPLLAPAKAGLAPRRSGHPSRCHLSPSRPPVNAPLYQSNATGNFRTFIDIGVDNRHRKK
jgi:hypothetical protein